ncbi:hypothetical protein B5P46_11680 [Rhizobium leguminosarum]|uniref:ASCH domain-containing protein n=1 Tax=Rhizobium leguminosarum TaxID=384 RepID=A0A4Q1UE79_RHILE|nr:hypothetical protein [Rhizobium leguminosarum]RXT29335.1 hypothetical protein B5P46_11680 [Rhizobium leguminosarum]
MMKALTIWQPWATLIAIGAKPYEFRGWKPPGWLIGKRLAIHAAARPMKFPEIYDLHARLSNPSRGETPCLHAAIALPLLTRILEAEKRALPSLLPLSHVVCTVIVGDPKRGDACAAEFGDAAGNDSDRDDTFNWGWPMLEVDELAPPAPACGAQGVWNWSGP